MDQSENFKQVKKDINLYDEVYELASKNNSQH